MARKEYQVAREPFWVNAVREEGEGRDGVVMTGTAPDLEVPCDVRVEVRAGLHVEDTIRLLKAIVVGLIEEGYLFGCPNGDWETL